MSDLLNKLNAALSFGVPDDAVKRELLAEVDALREQTESQDWPAVADRYVRQAMSQSSSNVDGLGPARKSAMALTSIAASLVAQNSTRLAMLAQVETEAYNRGYENARDQLQDWDAVHERDEKLSRIRGIVESLEGDQPEHGVRWLRAFLAGRELPGITPEEPEPERDWSKVKAHLFKPGGKWMYQVFLDYTGERHLGVPGEGPAGWHWDGHEMAKRALARATDNGTSGVSIRELGEYWHLFVPDPPQGFPMWVQPGDPNERVDV
jgi:hypothetical protein